MTESTSRFHSVEGYPLDSGRVSLATYRLLSHFSASKSIADLCIPGPDCPFSGLRDEHEQAEIAHLLIEIATLVRIAQDSLHHNSPDVAAALPQANVGTLRESESSQRRTQLGLRDACNKIIHAKDITFDVRREEKWYARYLMPRVFLYGTFRREHWKATLKIRPFCAEVFELCRIT